MEENKKIFIKDIEILEKEEGDYPFECKHIFKNGTYWTSHFKTVAKSLRLLSLAEDKKYPGGMGRNMFFLAYLYPLYKKYLEENGFKIDEHDLKFAKKQTAFSDRDLEEYLNDIKKMDEKLQK